MDVCGYIGLKLKARHIILEFSHNMLLLIKTWHRTGLLEVPTFLVNVMTPWGTVLMYFRMPDWVKDLDESIVEKMEDPDNIKAFKVRRLLL